VIRRRRGQNEGSVFQRLDGRWCGIISLGRRDNGRPNRKYFYGATAGEVQEAMTKAKGDVLKGLSVAVERQTVGQFLERWLEQSAKPTVRPLTYEQYAQHVKLYLAPTWEREKDEQKVETYRPLPALGAIALAKLGPQHVEAFRNNQLKAHGRFKRPLSPRTVQLSLVILRRALDQAVKWGLAARNVAKFVDLPRTTRHEVRPFTEDQVRSFFAAIKGERLEAAYLVAVTLGLRRGEILGLRWRDVDLDARTLTVAQALTRVGGKRFGGISELRFVEPKSASSRRTIPLPESVAGALRDHRTRRPGVADGSCSLAGAERRSSHALSTPTSSASSRRPNCRRSGFTT
jgi:integrase